MNKKADVIFWDDRKKQPLVVALLKQDEVVIGGTDTVYGFLGQLTQKAKETILNEKLTSPKKPLIVLVNSVKKLEKFVDLSAYSSIKNLIASCWPGPLTIIFKARSEVSSFLKAENGTIAIRIPSHQGLLTLLESFDGLFSTSANISGNSTSETFEQLDNVFLNSVPLVVRNRQDIQGLASTIIDCSIITNGDKKIKLIRSGAFPVEELERMYGELFSK
jgi:L-threonylcarbamoyladenylate synthase